MRKNSLRELLKQGKPTLGTIMITTHPQTVEIIGHSGLFDYIELDGEDASWDVMSLENFARAVELFPSMTAMMKVEREPRFFITTRSLGAGIQNLLFADCYSADEVRECVKCVRAASPQDKGYHGCNLRRSTGYFKDIGNEAWAQAQREAVIAIMIEKVGAVEQMEEIFEIEGVDMMTFGPCDYAINIGKPGAYYSAEVQQKLKEVVKLAIKKGVRPRVEIASFEEAKPFLDMGVRDFCVGTDLAIIYEFCKSTGEKMRKMLEGA